MNVLRGYLRFLLIFLGVFALWQLIMRVGRKLLHFPAPAFIGYFLDSKLRRKMQPPSVLIERSGFRTGMRVMEIGCGSGGFTTFVARAVGEGGLVLGLDIQTAMLNQIRRKLRRAENQDIHNLMPVQGSAYELPLAKDSLDAVYLVTVLQEIPDIPRTLAEVQRVLKPGGILAVTELLPDPDYVFAGTTVRVGKTAGFQVDAVKGNLWTYTVRFKKT